MRMQTALHITALVSDLQSEIVGGEIIGTEFYKKERAAFIYVKKGGRMVLGFSFHPTGAGSWLIPASKLKLTTREKPRPVFAINSGRITAVEQLGTDRIFRLRIEQNDQSFWLLFEAIGPNGNIWRLDSENRRTDSLRRRQFEQGAKYQPLPPMDRLDPFDLDADKLGEHLARSGSGSLVVWMEKNLIGFSRTLAREAVTRAELDFIAPDDVDPEGVARLTGVITQIIGFFAKPATGYLYALLGGFEAYPFKLSAREEQPERFKTLSLAVKASTERRLDAVAVADDQKQINDALRRAVKRLEGRIVKIEKDIAEAEKHEHYKKLGELLQINLPQIKKGMTSVVVEDVYLDSHDDITIELDPSLSPHLNAEAYFKKYRKGREGLALLQRRLEISRGELDQLQRVQADLEADFDSARERYRVEIASLMPRVGAAAEAVERLPYREYTLSTGLKIFVGRDGSDNDRTTFEFARPYELWFHTQQCPGSHVVIKSPNKSFEPSRAEIEETAAIAAWYSKAKHDSLVPVIYAPRKYVRKPRKAKPGLVTVEREKSVMVAPTKPQNNDSV